MPTIPNKCQTFLLLYYQLLSVNTCFFPFFFCILALLFRLQLIVALFLLLLLVNNTGSVNNTAHSTVSKLLGNNSSGNPSCRARVSWPRRLLSRLAPGRNNKKLKSSQCTRWTSFLPPSLVLWWHPMGNVGHHQHRFRTIRRLCKYSGRDRITYLNCKLNRNRSAAKLWTQNVFPIGRWSVSHTFYLFRLFPPPLPPPLFPLKWLVGTCFVFGESFYCRPTTICRT